MWCCTESSRHGSNAEGDNLISFLGVFLCILWSLSFQLLDPVLDTTAGALNLTVSLPMKQKTTKKKHSKQNTIEKKCKKMQNHTNTKSFGKCPCAPYAVFFESCQSWADKPHDCSTSSASSVCCRKLCCTWRRSQKILEKLPIFISRSVFQGTFCSLTVLHFCFCTSFFRSSPTPAPSPDADVHCWPGICQLFISCQFFQFPRSTSHGTVRKKGFFFGSWPLARQQWSQHPAICHQLLDGWRTLSAKLPGETKKWTKIN